MITFTWSPAVSYTTVVFFPSPGVSFDFASFNFHVPIFGSSAAKHAAPAKKQSARVNPIVLIFMPPSSTDFQVQSMFVFKLANGKRVRISGYELWKIDNDGLIAGRKANSTAQSTTAGSRKKLTSYAVPTRHYELVMSLKSLVFK